MSIQSRMNNLLSENKLDDVLEKHKALFAYLKSKNDYQGRVLLKDLFDAVLADRQAARNAEKKSED